MTPDDSRQVKLGRFALYAVNPLTWAKAAGVATDWSVDLFARHTKARAMVLDEPERPLRADDPPSLFLREKYQVVEFAGREDELQILETWALDRTRAVSAMLVTGGPGCGKSRLARRICKVAIDDWNDPWLAGALNLDELPDPEPIGIADATRIFEPLMEWRGPVLLVIDYAERQAKYVEAILKAATRASRGEHQFRVLLLARSAGDWWRELRAEFDAEVPEHNPFHGIPPLALPPLTMDAEAHAEEFERAYHYFCEAMSANAAGEVPRPQKFHGRIEVLDVHAAALLTACGDTLPPEVEEEQLFDALLRREELKHWRPATSIWKVKGELAGRPFKQAVAWLAMIDEVSNDAEAAERLKALPNWRNEKPASLEAAIGAIKSVYPGSSDSWWSGVQPDRLTTYLTRQVPDDALRRSSSLTASQLESVLRHLTWSHQRASSDTGRVRDEAKTRTTIKAAAPMSFWAAFQNALAYGDPCGHIAAEVFSQKRADSANEETRAVALALHDATPKQTTALRELAAVATEILVATVTEKTAKAAFLSNLGIRYADLGRSEDALAVAKESLGIHRRLAEAQPDAFLPNLASSLSNLGNRYADLGRHDQALAAAEEAANIRRELAEVRPDIFLPDLASSLNNLGNHYSELGRREEGLAAAEEAVEIRRRLAEAQSDAFLPDLAMSLNNLGNRYSDLGRHDEALAVSEEAVSIDRKLAESRPDAFLPDLAASLNNLGNRYSDLDCREKALDLTEGATRIYRKLAESRPDAFLPNLASSLSNLGNRYADLGHHDEALAAAEEAVMIRRKLSQARPGFFLPQLADSLNNLGNRYSELDRREEGLAVAEEAVEIRRRLAEAQSDAFLPDLAMSLNNLGGHYASVGRQKDALETAEKAISLYRKLAEAEPDAFVPDLARSFGTLGSIQRSLNNYPAARDAFAKGIATLAAAFHRMRPAHGSMMAALAKDYLDSCETVGEEPDQALVGPIREKLDALAAEEEEKEERS